jgi:hypothetical protein
MSKRPSITKLTYTPSTIRHRKTDDIQSEPQILQNENTHRILKLMDLLALLLVTERKGGVVALTFKVDPKSSIVYVFLTQGIRLRRTPKRNMPNN